MNVIRLEVQRTVRREVIKGIEFFVGLSPFFFPDRIEHGYKQETGCYLIEFKYIDEEEGEVGPKPDDVVSLTVGRHTGRLLSVCIHVDEHELDRIKMLVADKVPKAIEGAKQRSPEAAENYQVAEELLREYGSAFAMATA